MSSETLFLGRRRVLGLTAVRSTTLLGVLIAASVVVRAVVARRHDVPRFFPDEYIYTALARSIGHGHLAIRGSTALFPGVFEPLLAAPLWRLFSTGTAYHLVQTENALVASLAAVPVYVLARKLRLGNGYALASALYALAAPSLVLVAYTQTDAVGYTVALAAVAAGVLSLEEPTTKRQAWFLVFFTLACATRVEFFVIAVSYAVAAIVLDRRGALRRHGLALASLVPGAASVLIGSFGYYLTDPGTRHYGLGAIAWLGLQPFFLTIVAGVAIVPGAVAGVVFVDRERRIERGFALLSSTLAVLLVGEASKVAYETHRFKERYLFLLLPLVALAFGIYRRNGRPGRWVVVAVSAAIVLTLARLPLSEYFVATYKTDSQFLIAASDAGNRIGIANASLLIALLGTLLAALAIAATRFARATSIAFVASLLVAALTSVDASYVDLVSTRSIRSAYPSNLTWVDDAQIGPVTAVETAPSPPGDLLFAMYWNSSIQREAVLQGAIPTDAFSTSDLRVGASGEVAGIGRNLLVDDFGTTMIFTNAQVKARESHFILWHASTKPRLRTLIVGRFHDGWLSAKGSLRFWPARPGAAGVRASFRLTLPRHYSKSVRLRIGTSSFVLHAGSHIDVSCRASGSFDERYSASAYTLQQSELFRRISVKLTRLQVADVGRRAGGSGCSATASG